MNVFLVFFQCKLEDRVHMLVNGMLDFAARSVKAPNADSGRGLLAGADDDVVDPLVLLREVVVPAIISGGSMPGLLANLLSLLRT